MTNRSFRRGENDIAVRTMTKCDLSGLKVVMGWLSASGPITKFGSESSVT